MPKILSHGTWSRGPNKTYPSGSQVQTFFNESGVDWYDYAHKRLLSPDTLKILVRDGIVAMVERDGTMIVPPGEVFEMPPTLKVDRGWLWHGDRFGPAPILAEDPVAKLKTFLDANPDVKAVLG